MGGLTLASGVSVGILGPITVFASGEDAGLRGRRVSAVLAVLAVRANAVVTTDQLIDCVWGDDPPAQARASLQMHVTKLRRLLAGSPVTIDTVQGGYRLVAPTGSVDGKVFLELTEDARSARSEERWKVALARSRSALDLWRGDRVEVPDEMPCLSSDFAELDEGRRQARLVHAEALLGLGSHEDAVPFLEEAVAAEPFVERFWELLILALYRCGRQAEALAAYRRVDRLLGEELGILPGPSLVRLEEQVLTQAGGLAFEPSDSSVELRLPERATPLIGREPEIGRVVESARQNRAVQILGPGGVGKTSAAVEAARRLATDHADGAAFIDLSQSSQGDRIPEVIAEQLGLATDDDPLGAVMEFLRSRQEVLVLDNCEQIARDVSRVVCDLLERCPDLTLLMTSRVRLDTNGAPCVRLDPLACPEVGHVPESIDEFPAVRMFVDRARSSVPGLAVDRDDLPVIGDICRSVDGLPLALELVASWVGSLTLADIGRRVGASLPVEEDAVGGRPDRHTRLLDTVEWSFRLLSDSDAEAFTRLSVFVDGFGVPGAVAVIDRPESEVLAILRRLVDASMLGADVHHDRVSYRMLDTLRAFGVEQFDADPHRADVIDRYRRFVVGAATSPPSGGDTEWFGEIRRLMPDLRRVLDWAESDDPETVTRVAERLRPFWTQQGYGAEIEPRLERVIDRVSTADGWYTLGVLKYARGAFAEAREALEKGLAAAVDDVERARTSNALGVLMLEGGDYKAASNLYREAETLFEKSGHEGGRAAALLNQGIAAVNLHDLEAANEAFDEAWQLFRRTGDRREEAHALLRLAFVAELEDRPEVAVTRARASLALLEPLGPGLALADALQYTAEFEVGAGSLDHARDLLVRAVELFAMLDHPPGLQRSMITATAILVGAEKWAEAAEMSVDGAEIRRRLGIPVPAANRDGVVRLDRLVADHIPETRLDVLAEGARLATTDTLARRLIDTLAFVAVAQDAGVHVMTTSE